MDSGFLIVLAPFVVMGLILLYVFLMASRNQHKDTSKKKKLEKDSEKELEELKKYV